VTLALPRIGEELSSDLLGTLEAQSYVANGYFITLSALLILAEEFRNQQPQANRANRTGPPDPTDHLHAMAHGTCPPRRTLGSRPGDEGQR
jgi:hypothetical protein